MKASEKIQAMMDELALYREDKGFPHPQDRMVDHYINLTGSELKEMSDEDLGIANYELCAKSNYLNDFINEKRTKREACKQQMMKTVGWKTDEYNAYYFQDKLRLACMDNDYAAKLLELYDKLDLLLMSCDGAVKKLDSLTYAISTILKQREKENVG